MAEILGRTTPKACCCKILLSLELGLLLESRILSPAPALSLAAQTEAVEHCTVKPHFCLLSSLVMQYNEYVASDILSQLFPHHATYILQLIQSKAFIRSLFCV